jgi:thiopurine S-methyltransferase
MDPDFWHQRWNTNQIGFHQPKPNEKLKAYWPDLALPAGSPVFVPLCGKSLDMVWLADQGHRVIGIELSEKAIDEFFAERGLTPTTRQSGALTCKSAGPYELWCGDFFALPSNVLANITAVYDRASLIALPPSMRSDFAARLTAHASSATAKIFLITFEYDQSRVEGPPHAVLSDEVSELFGSSFQIDPVDRSPEKDSIPPKLRDNGIEEAIEATYILTPKTART